MTDIKNNPILGGLLKTIAGIADTPKGAYNIRVDGKGIGRQSTKNIEIVPKPEGKGIEIYAVSYTHLTLPTNSRV